MFHYKNRAPFTMKFDFEGIIEKHRRSRFVSIERRKPQNGGKHIPIACGFYNKSDYPYIGR